MFRKAVSAALLIALPSCAAGAPGEESVGEPIRKGERASTYPESVLLDLMKGAHRRAYCSGALIAPWVVLTAGHCVQGYDGWRVSAPYASSQTARARVATTFDWDAVTEKVDPGKHDVGLVFLDSPITLGSYPVVADAPVGDGDELVNVGRIHDGTLSHSSLFASPPINVKSASAAGYPFDYIAVDEIEPGDSGGPDFTVGTHTLVAVNSGAGSGTEVLARVDLLAPWIQDQVAVNGGGASSAGDPDTADPDPDPDQEQP
jgi:Trypsin